MTEIWKQYKNTQYLISTLGNVWSNKSEKLLKVKDNCKGYLAVNIDDITIAVHRLVAITFIENKDLSLEVNHINGVKTDNRVENLEWLSHVDNMKHAWSNDMCVSGSDTYIAVLNEENVENIKKLFVEYELNNTEIGLLFGVNKGTISKIRTLDTWKQVRPDLVFPAKSPKSSICEKKLSGKDIPDIRTRHELGESLASIGRDYNVHSGTISGIISGKTWKNY
jgi:hypothetical protein